jgi:hypothetical protein
VNRKKLSVQWVKLALEGDLLKVTIVIPNDKLLRVKWIAPNSLGLREGDMLKRVGDFYEVTKKKGRDSVGGVLLSNLTIGKSVFDALTREATKKDMTVNELRREILNRWLIERNHAV